MLNFCYRIIDVLLPAVVLCGSAVIFEIEMPENLYLYLAFTGGSLMLIINELRGSYHKININRVMSRQLEVTTESWVFIVLSIIVYFYLSGNSHLLSRRALVAWFVATPFVVFLLKLLVTNIYLKKSKPVKILCVGSPVQFTVFEKNRIKNSNIEIINKDNLSDFKRSADIVSVIFNYESPPQIEELKELTHLELSGVKLISTNEFYERYLRKCYIPYNTCHIEFMNDIKRLRKTNLILKQCIDLSAAIVLGLISLPVILFSIKMIRKESPGSVFFKQKRVGGMMKPFTVFKFRSMHENSIFNPYTQEKDERIFPYGNFMRKMRIDELPQLWNVVKGEMHFIGPRAEWTILVDNYEKEIPYYHERHLMKPGITGWAQVMYPYGANTEDARQKLMYDLYYIKHWSVWLEIETIIRTIGVVLGKKGL